jgi:hypothetical protein
MLEGQGAVRRAARVDGPARFQRAMDRMQVQQDLRGLLEKDYDSIEH